MTRIIGLLAAFACFIPAPLTAADPPPGQDEREMKRFIDALKILEDNSATPFDIDQAFYQGAIPGNAAPPLDPHSVFFDPDQYAQMKQMETSTSKGFGTVVSILPGRVLVLQTMPNSPSAKSGMMPGDEILAVNNYRLDRLELDQIVELLNESKQKPARLVVHHPGNARFTELPTSSRPKRCGRLPALSVLFW